MNGPQVEIRPGALQSLGRVIDDWSAGRVWLVTGRHSFDASGAAAIVTDVLGSRVVGQFQDFSENPTIEEIRRGVTALREANPDAVVAIGGGSALDAAKQINVCAANEADVREYITGCRSPDVRGLPLVACPTTGGTGSEVTHFAVCYEGLTKYSFVHPFLRPDSALVDPELTLSLTGYQAASCAMDALSQLIESLWAVGANDLSRSSSAEGIPILLAAVKASVLDHDMDARLAMAQAAHLSGLAIDVARTTAAHALSYPISIRYGLAHGHAVAMTLPEFVTFNFDVTDADCQHPQGPAFVRELVLRVCSMFGVTSAAELRASILALMQDLGLHRDFFKIGIRSVADAIVILENVNIERLGNNPRRVSSSDLEDVIAGAISLRTAP